MIFTIKRLVTELCKPLLLLLLLVLVVMMSAVAGDWSHLSR